MLVDQEFVGNIVQGELKVDMICRDPTDYSTESYHVRDSRESYPDCTHGANYPVSPRDLSIRLKVIQHRLEDWIKELESDGISLVLLVFMILCMVVRGQHLILEDNILS
jgi:hypothetical protein